MDKEQYIQAKKDILEYESKEMHPLYARMDYKLIDRPVQTEYFNDLEDFLNFAMGIKIQNPETFSVKLVTKTEFDANYLPF